LLVADGAQGHVGRAAHSFVLVFLAFGEGGNRLSSVFTELAQGGGSGNAHGGVFVLQCIAKNGDSLLGLRIDTSQGVCRRSANSRVFVLLDYLEERRDRVLDFRSADGAPVGNLVRRGAARFRIFVLQVLDERSNFILLGLGKRRTRAPQHQTQTKQQRQRSHKI